MASKVENEVKHILKEIGVKPSLRGYYYWARAVDYVLDSRN